MINVHRVKSRVQSGGHDVPEEKPFRIFKKRKTEYFYDECSDWLLEDIELLTGIECVQRKNLNES